MTLHRLAVAALTALALAASAAARADNPPGGKDQERMTAWASKLGLSNQQQEQIRKVCTDFEDRADPVEEQLWKLHHEAFDAVKATLTQEQRDKLPEVIKTDMAREGKALADKLGLSEEQRQKVERIREEYEPKFREVCSQSSDAARKQMHQLRSEFIHDVRQVLSDEQRAKFWGVMREEFHRWRDPVARHERLEELANQLGVSADQKAQIQKVCGEYRPRFEKAATQLKELCHEHRAAVEKVLTDEQRTKARDLLQAFTGTSGASDR
jgi:Spy/CpxP family protein refolding chaperone